MNHRKRSISTLLVSVIGLIVILKVFVYVVEHYVLQVTGQDSLHVDDSYLNIALVVVVVLLILRIGFVLMKHKKRTATSEISEDASMELDSGTFECAECGSKVSVKVRQYCLERPERFGGDVYCYDHQRTMKA